MATVHEVGGAEDSMLRENEDVMKEKLLELQKESLVPLKEDLADWISKHLGIDITTDSFMNVLDNGVYLCQMAKLITQKAEECVADGSHQEPLPSYKLRCKNNAPSGSWFARDNTANFLSWCKAYGMADDQRFETEYLVSHTDEKSVVVCLLELARIGCKFGLEPPSLIKMEKEIEEEVPESFKPPSPKLNTLIEELSIESDKSDNEEPTIQELPPPLPPSLDEAVHGFAVSQNEEPTIEELYPPPPPPPPPHHHPAKPRSLDEAVKRIAFLCKCRDHVKKLGKGKYLIFGKEVHIRFLNNRHLMVRVGGGWETFEHYLKYHKPVQVFEHKRPSSASNGNRDHGDTYLSCTSRYKPSNY